MGIEAAVIGATLLSATASSVAENRAENIADEEQGKIDRANKAAQEEAERIARETRPEGESLEAIKFGAGEDDGLGSTSQFLVPKKTATSLGVSPSSSGLGFSV